MIFASKRFLRSSVSSAAFQAGLVGGLQGRIIKVLPVQPGVVGICPGLSAGVDQTMAQQELRDPVPGPHQVRRGRPRGHAPDPGQPHPRGQEPVRGYLSEQGQPGQMLGVAGIGLHPVSGRPLKLRRCRNQALDPCTGQYPGQSEAGRTCFIDNEDRARQSGNPVGDPGIVRGQTLSEDLARFHGRSRSPSRCVHGHPNRRKYAYSWLEPPDVQMWLYQSTPRTYVRKDGPATHETL